MKQSVGAVGEFEMGNLSQREKRNICIRVKQPRAMQSSNLVLHALP